MRFVGVSVILASASPRRRELLSRIVSEFEIVVADVDEAALTGDDPFATAETLASAKARTVFATRPDSLVIGADTVVAAELRDGSYRQFAKPRDAADACATLADLSGRRHRVITGVAIAWPGGFESFLDSCSVTFRDLSAAEIEAYVATGEPMDKAGSYAIQGGAAGFAQSVEGSIDTIVGLPVAMLEARLKAILGR